MFPSYAKYARIPAGAFLLEFTDKDGDSSDLTTYTFNVDCGGGGDMVVAAFGTAVSGSPGINSWTLDGQTITDKVSRVEGNLCAHMGSCSNVSAGTNTLSITWATGMRRCMVFIYRVENADIVTPVQTRDNATANLSFSPYGANGGVIAVSGTSSGTAFSGVSGLTNWDGNQSNEANMTGGHDETSAASTSISFTGGGTPIVTIGMELGPG